MAYDWLILHAGALGDLVLTIQLALRLQRGGAGAGLHLISRSNPGDLSVCQPRIRRQSADGLGLHWLYAEHDNPPPDVLRSVVQDVRVLSALGDVDSIVHRRLESLRPAELLSFDPRPRPDLRRHITQQWQTDLENQGLLVPKCIHQRPTQRHLGVPESLRSCGREVLQQIGCNVDSVLIHAGSGGRAKCWPLANFLAVGQQLRERSVGVCFLIGPAELERWPTADLTAIERRFPVLKLPRSEALADVLAAVRAVIANDSGPAHLSALLGTHVVTIFGATSPATWRPLGPSVHILTGDPGSHPDDWGIDLRRVVALALDQPARRRPPHRGCGR